MAVTATLFGNYFVGQFGSTAARRVDWPADTVKCALTTSAYTPDADVHDFFDDVTNEITGTGYTAGGVSVTTKTVSYDSASNETRLDCDDPAWTGLVATFRKAVFYKSTGTASTSPLIMWVDLGADVALGVATNWSLVIPATGIWKVTS
jgi:hypothetical protein